MTDSIWPPPSADAATKHAHYFALLSAAGIGTRLDRPLLLGIRGLELGGTEPHDTISRPAYDDAFVLLAEGIVREFRGSTHPYQHTTRATVDVDHDGTPDVGTIRPGRYVMQRLQTAPFPKLWIKGSATDPRVPTWRDTNHDGTITDAERDASEERQRGEQSAPDVGDFATEVLLHPGFDCAGPSGKAFSSIGCQTAHLSDVAAVATFAELDYLLLDARTLLDAAASPFTDEQRREIEGSVALTTEESAEDALRGAEKPA
jgi:hypothetical protein